MLQFAHQSSSIRRVTNAAILCVLAALSGCSGCSNVGSSGSSSTVAAQTYSLSQHDQRAQLFGARADGQWPPAYRRRSIPRANELSYSGQMQMVNATAVSVAAGQTTQGLASSLPSGTSYSVTVQRQPTGETCTVAGGTGMILSANVANVVVTCSNQAYSLERLDQRLEWLGSGAGKRHRYACRELGSHELYDAQPGCLHQQLCGHRTDAAGGFGLCGWQRHGHHAGRCGDERGHHLHRSTLQPRGHDQRSWQQLGAHAHQRQRYARGCRRQHQLHDAHTGCLWQPLLSCGADCPGGPHLHGEQRLRDDAGQQRGQRRHQPARISRTPSAARLAGWSAAAWCWPMAAIRLAVKPGASSFTMPTAVAYTSAYAVTVQTQPAGLTCSLGNGTGTMGSAAVTNIAVTCSANTYTVGGTISGLTASGLVLLDNGGDATTISANATQFTMNTGVAYGSAYAITVQTPPDGPRVLGEQWHQAPWAQPMSRASASPAGRTSAFCIPLPGAAATAQILTIL